MSSQENSESDQALDLAGYPADVGRSLVQVTCGALAVGLSRLGAARERPAGAVLKVGFIGLGIAVGVLVGLILISLDPSI